ncbi:unnamed protein product [Caretta caretta]
MELEQPGEHPEPRAAAGGKRSPRNGFCRESSTEHDPPPTTDVEQMSFSSPVLPMNSVGNDFCLKNQHWKNALTMEVLSFQ